MRQLCRDASPGAVERLIKLATARSPVVALRAIGMLLDRAWGTSPAAYPEEQRLSLADLTREQILQIRDRMNDRLAANGSPPEVPLPQTQPQTLEPAE